MTDWPEFLEALLELAADPGRPLTAYPSLDPTPRRSPPFHVGLRSTAQSDAADLHERFGQDVVLTVGRLPYPPADVEQLKFDDGPEADPAIISCKTREPLVVPSGGRLEAVLEVTNRSRQKLQVSDGPWLQGRVTDPRTGQVVGWSATPMILPVGSWKIAPESTVGIPMLLGTDSCRMDLGYAVPPGQWTAYAPFTLDAGTGESRVRTPPLPLTIT
jgi:hypothetical protein